MLQDANAAKLSSIKTYLLIALIFNILAIIAFALVSLILILTVIGIIVVGFVAVPLILDIVIFGKINRMKRAAESRGHRHPEGPELSRVGHHSTVHLWSHPRNTASDRAWRDKRTPDPGGRFHVDDPAADGAGEHIYR